MLYGGTFEHYPDIKFILPHAGGAIPYVAARFASFVRNEESLKHLQNLIMIRRGLPIDLLFGHCKSLLSQLISFLEAIS
jgi:hypothetical protein